MINFSNLNPFNFEKKANWGSDGARHLKNMAEAQKRESDSGNPFTKRYQGKAADGEDVVRQSTQEEIKRYLQAKPGERGSLNL
jgi:hypothetical protein